MSPLSFLSSFAFPAWSSIPVPSIGSYIPENIQKRLVSYLLQRTLGKFVKQDGLQLEGIEAAINQGRISLTGLQIDTEGVNATLPAGCPYRFREGQLDSIDISLPFPNLWSGPLSLGISSIRLILESVPVDPLLSATPSFDVAEEWDLDKSIYAASSDFVRTVLNQDEDERLQQSLYSLQIRKPAHANDIDLDPFVTADFSDNADDSPQAPGGFPEPHNPLGGQGTAGFIEGLLEALLARLQVSVGEIAVRLHHEIPAHTARTASTIDFDLNIKGIRYALNQVGTDRLPKKTLTINDLGLWMSSEKVRSDLEEQTPTSRDPARERVDNDMMMSFGIADLRESRYDIADMHDSDGEAEDYNEEKPTESLYESAIGEETPSASHVTDSPRGADVRNKVFGLRRRGIVAQMWKEPVDTGQDTNSEESPRTQARLSVDLGDLAAMFTTEQVESLVKVVGSFPSSRQRRQPDPSAPSGLNQRQASVPQCEFVVNQVDLQYFYTSTLPEASQLAAFWNHCDLKAIGQDYLHLKMLNMKMTRTERDMTTISLSSCTLVDLHRHSTEPDQPLRMQPIFLIGENSERIWLPSSEDVRQEAKLAGSRELRNETQFSVTFSESGLSLLLGHIRLYLDPSQLERLSHPIHQLSAVYLSAFQSTGSSRFPKDESTARSTAMLRLSIRHFSTRIYSAYSQKKAVHSDTRRMDRVGLDLGAIYLDRSVDAVTQAKVDWIQANLRELDTAESYIWFTCGNTATAGDLDKALDLRYQPNRSKRISMVIAILTLQLDQAVSHRLQYFADDCAVWFDRMSSESNTASKQDLRVIGSRIFAQDDLSLDTDSIDSESTIDEGMHVECVVLEALVSVQVSDSVINLRATNLDTIIRGVTGLKKGTLVDCTIFSVEMSETVVETGQNRTILRSDMRHNAGSGLDTRPVIILSLLSTQENVTSYKETVVSVNLSNTFANISPGVPWLQGLQSVFSSPSGVFENVIPSDSTKVSVTMRDCTAFMPAMTRQGAISIDIGHCAVKTRLLPSTIQRTVDCKLAEIAISLSDNYTLVGQKKQSGLIAEDGDFALICLLRETRLVFSATPERNTKVDVSFAGIDVSLCADTLEILQEVVGHISQGWPPIRKDTATACTKPTTTCERSLSTDNESLLGSVSDLAPSLAASSFEEDLLHDDLPSNTDFVTKNSGTSRKTNAAKLPRVKETGEAGSIRILSQDAFDLYQDYMTELEDSKMKSENSSTSPLLVIGTAVDIRVLLYSGYDWHVTRSAIESETEVVRRRLRKLSQMISSGNVPPQELRRTNVELFNSVHIGIRDDDEYQDDDQLLAAIDNELADLDSETASHATFRPQSSARSNASSPKATSAVKVKLRRSRRPQMEISLRDTAFRYMIDDPEADVVGSLKLTMQRAEIIDHIKSSTWKTFMTEMKTNSANGLAETEAKMLRVLVEWVNPGLQQIPEARINVDVAPLRFHIDQDALDFMKRFFSFSRHSPSTTAPLAEPASKSSQGFIQYVEIQPIQVKMDYKPKRLNIKALQQGSAMEVINLFHFEGATMTLRHVTMNGVASWGDLYSQLLSIWTPDVKANQMSDLLTGIAPVRSMVKAGSGVADLILLPLEQYRKDGKVVKGIRRGASSFASNTLSEFATVGAQLATGTQVILEKAERALGGRHVEDSHLPDLMESINFTEYEASLSGKRSRYADQPADLNQGISAAYMSLASNLTSAAQTILAVPMEVMEEPGNRQSATRAVIRAVPIAVLQSMIGITDASRKTLFGVKNQLDPKNQGDKESKYKRR